MEDKREGRRGWAPKDFKHGRPTLEHLVSLGILERVRGEKKGRRAKWLYRSSPELPKKVEMKDGQALLIECKYDSPMIRDRRRIMLDGVSLGDLTITRVLSMKPKA